MYNEDFKAVVIRKEDFTPEEISNYEYFIEILADLVLSYGTSTEKSEK